ncbi:MAG: PorT family protein [Chitinispirillales bacterium]|jgi:hypothetical protein|nr:PorT family protein [Chitinispirillales bacterium]
MKKVPIVFLLSFCLCSAAFAQDRGGSPAVEEVTQAAQEAALAGEEESAEERQEPAASDGEPGAAGNELSVDESGTAIQLSGKEIIAVYVIGGNDQDENITLGGRITGAILGGERFMAVERTKAFTARAARGKRTRRVDSGSVTASASPERITRPDFKRIGAWGKQNGANYVCLVEVKQAGKSYKLSIHIISAESGNSLISVRSGSIETREKLRDVAVTAVNAMLSVFVPEQRYKRVKFGARTAYNVSHVGKVDDFSANYHDGQTVRSIYTKDNDKFINGLNGIEFGLVMNIEIWRFLAFNLESNFVYRTPLNGKFTGSRRGDYSLREYAVSFPALFQLKLSNPLFLLAGVQLDIPFNTKLKWEEVLTVEIDNRKPVDFGLTGGLGWRIGQNFVLDVRYVYSLTKFIPNTEYVKYEWYWDYDTETGDYRYLEKEKKHRLYQINAGVQYLF